MEDGKAGSIVVLNASNVLNEDAIWGGRSGDIARGE